MARANGNLLLINQLALVCFPTAEQLKLKTASSLDQFGVNEYPSQLKQPRPRHYLL
jgi:hypothetical protein